MYKRNHPPERPGGDAREQKSVQACLRTEVMPPDPHTLLSHPVEGPLLDREGVRKKDKIYRGKEEKMYRDQRRKKKCTEIQKINKRSKKEKTYRDQKRQQRSKKERKKYNDQKYCKYRARRKEEKIGHLMNTFGKGSGSP